MKTAEQLIPQLRFSEFEGNWCLDSLRNTSTLITKGTTPKKLSDEGVNYVKIESLDGVKINKDNCLLVDKDIHNNELKRSILKEKDILFAIAGATIGKLGIVNSDILPANTNQALAIIRLKNSKSVFFISQILQSRVMKKYIEMNISVGAQPNLNLQQINDFNFYIPQLPEQQKIASFLTDVDAKITKLTKKKTLLEQYKKGVMQKIFNQELRFKDDDGNEFADWEEKTLKQLLKTYKLGGNYSNSDKITNRPLIKMGNLGRGNILTKKVQYIDETETIDEDDKIKKGDLFFNTRNTLDLVGKVAIWRNELPLAYYNSNLMRFEFDNNYFMNYRLNSNEGIKGLKRYATGTTSVAAIYTKDLLKLKLNIPCPKEQTKIANFLSDIDVKIEVLNTKIENSKSFKKGLLQKMFV